MAVPPLNYRCSTVWIVCVQTMGDSEESQKWTEKIFTVIHDSQLIHNDSKACSELFPISLAMKIGAHNPKIIVILLGAILDVWFNTM